MPPRRAQDVPPVPPPRRCTGNVGASATRRGARLWATVLLCATSLVAARGQDVQVDGAPLRPLVERAVLPLALAEGRLAGAGAEALQRRIASASWTLFGEQHGVPGLADVVAAALRTADADALALEMGPWVAEELGTYPVEHVIREAPFSFAFDDDGEFGLLETAVGAPDGRLQIWGLDQEITAIHPLAALAADGATARVRRTARGLYLKAVLRAGVYVRQRHDADVDLLRAAAWRDGARAGRVLDGIARSQEIFALHRAGEGAAAAALRETYLFDRFAAAESALCARLGRTPRVVVKIGGAHVMERAQPNGVPSLGDRLRALADSIGARAFTVGIRRYDPARSPFPLDGLFPSGGQDVRAVYFETAELRAPGAALAPALRERVIGDLQGFDAIMYLQADGPAPRTRVRDAEAAFRSRVLRTLALSFWPVPLLLFAGLGALGTVAVRRLRGSAPGATGIVALLLGSLSLALVKAVALDLLRLSSGVPATTWPCHSWLPLALPAIVVAVSLPALWRARVAGRNGARRIWILTWCGAALWVSIAAAYWNLGATLGCS